MPRRDTTALRRVVLPRPEVLPRAPFWKTVAHRRSRRRYGPSPIRGEDLFLLLWATQGITQPGGRSPLRATPSAGALYPLETYVAVSRVEGLAAGLYHWRLPDEHLVCLAEDDDVASRLAGACLDQAMCHQAACTFIWTAVLPRVTAKYGERGERYAYLDAGHVGHGLQLAATALDLSSCNLGAFLDDELNALLGVDGQDEAAVYGACVGAMA